MKTRNILIILLIMISTGCRNREIKTSAGEVVRVRVDSILIREASIPVHSTGILVSSEEQKLSFKTGGIVSKINVNEGDRVKKGDLLASLNLSEINASADQARNGYEKALRDYKRAENLYRDSVVTLEQKQNAATALNVARSTLDIAEFNLVHSRIVAPDNGLILKLFVKQNELVASGYPVLLFGSSGRYWKIKTGLSDKDVLKVNPGDTADIFFDAYPGVKFFAIVDQVGEISNPYTGTFEIEMQLGGPTHRLASGFVAEVNIFPAEKKSFSMIPVGSVVEADGREGYIYIIAENMTARKIKVEIETLIGSMAAVRGIPSEVKEVVSEGAAYLKDGVRVEIVR